MTEPPQPKAHTSAERIKEQLGVIILTTFGIIQGAVLADLAVVVADTPLKNTHLLFSSSLVCR